MLNKKLSLSSNPDSITALETYLQEIIKEYRLCETKYPDILISLTEAVNNAIIHGNKNDQNKKVVVNCKSKQSGIYFSINDEGNGFDPASVPDPTSLDKIECCGGRGVYIINALADKVAYKNNGRTVELFFNLA
jgi:serine/threonine-protein kinase RsbW